MPRINLLPWREDERKERKVAFTVALVGTAFAYVAAILAGPGRLAQLVRALPSHGRGHGFESRIAHRETAGQSARRR